MLENFCERLNKITFASIDDYITEKGSRVKRKYYSLLEKYGLTGDMEYSGCLSIYKDIYIFTIGGIDTSEDMYGWTISNNHGDIIDSDSWNNIDDENEVTKSLKIFYTKCNELVKDSEFIAKLKQLVNELL